MNRLNGKSILFSIATVPVLILIYSVVNAQGLRVTIPALSTKLYKLPVPGFSHFEHLKNLRDLDLALILAMFMLCAVYVLTNAMVEILLFGPGDDQRLNVDLHVRFLTCLGSAMLLIDTCMFYRGISEQGFLDEGVTITPIIATIGYTGLLIFIAYFHVMLKRRIF
jgi:hypothetical protein